MIIINIVHLSIQTPRLKFIIPSFALLTHPTVQEGLLNLPPQYISNWYRPLNTIAIDLVLNLIHSLPSLIHYLILLKFCFPRTISTLYPQGLYNYYRFICYSKIQHNEILGILYSVSLSGNSYSATSQRGHWHWYCVFASPRCSLVSFYSHTCFPLFSHILTLLSVSIILFFKEYYRNWIIHYNLGGLFFTQHSSLRIHPGCWVY